MKNAKSQRVNFAFLLIFFNKDHFIEIKLINDEEIFNCLLGLKLHIKDAIIFASALLYE